MRPSSASLSFRVLSALRTPRPSRASLPLIGVSVVACLMGLSGAACSSAEVPIPPTMADGQPDPVLVAGRQVYIERCANCHGGDGGGGRGPALARGAMTEAYPEVADQIDLVSDGYRLMPSFGDVLTREQIEAVIRFTREVL